MLTTAVAVSRRKVAPPWSSDLRGRATPPGQRLGRATPPRQRQM